MGFADDLNSIAKNSNDRKKDENNAILQSIQQDVYRIKNELTQKVKEGTFNTPVGTRSVSCEWSLQNHYRVDVQHTRVFRDKVEYYYMVVVY